MAENTNYVDVLNTLSLSDNDQARREFKLAGTMPASLSNVKVMKTINVLGITPEDFAKSHASAEFNYELLKSTFRTYCKDFGDELIDKTPSKALEFSAKIIFEFGPYIWNEKKYKGNKAIRFRFPYVKTEAGISKLSIKVVIVTIFRDIPNYTIEDGDKMIMTFKQAGLLAMETFTKAIEYCYNKHNTILLTPLCEAIFSRDTIKDMAASLGVTELTVLYIINQSTTAGGQYLPYSDIACGIVSKIAATTRVTDKAVRFMMIDKVTKQYSHKLKQYKPNHFQIFSENALGEVPPGMDPDSLT